MSMSSAIAALETAMQRVLEEVKRLTPPSPHPGSIFSSAAVNRISPLQAHVVSSGDLHLSDGTQPAGPVQSVRSHLDGFAAWQPLTDLKDQPKVDASIPLKDLEPSNASIPSSTVLNPSSSPSTPNPTKPQQKIDAIRRSTNTKKSSCYRCGERGHVAASCCSSLVCFACNKVGHRSVTCKKPTLLPSLSHLTPSQMESLNSRPPMKFYSNKDTRRLRAILLKGVVLFDQQNRGAQFIQSHLRALI